MNIFRTFLILVVGFMSLTSCVDEGTQLIEDYGIFVNNVEGDYKSYSDEDWANALLQYEEFRLYASENNVELNQKQFERIEEYTDRFKKVQIKRDPLNHLLDIIMN